MYKLYPLTDPESENERWGCDWAWRNLYNGSMYVNGFKQIHDLRSKQFNRAMHDTRNNTHPSV